MVNDKVEFLSTLPIEGVLLDQYSPDKGACKCPYQIDPDFDLPSVSKALKLKDMKMYLGINTAIPIGMKCTAELFLTSLNHGCLLTKNGSTTDF